MTQLSNERVAWMNGEFLPESRCVVSFRDRSFKFGDGVFDTTRTFSHKLFKIKEHVDRLYRSLRYARIDPGIGPDEMIRLTEEVIQRNLHLIGPEDDYWASQRVSRGIEPPPGESAGPMKPTVIVECTPLPLAQRAKLFRDGIRVVVPSVRRVGPEQVSPRAKMHNYMNLILADQEAKANDPEAWAVLLDVNGNLTEGMGSNLFVVRDGVLLTPRAQMVLPGISRQTVIDLAGEQGLPVEECDIDLFDAYTADEAFLTSTSLCICPVAKINGRPFASGAVPGPVTQRLTQAYVDFVKLDFVAQHLHKLSA